MALKKYSPNRQLSSVSINISIPDAGLRFDSTVWFPSPPI
jgi:hypothetical protein